MEWPQPWWRLRTPYGMLRMATTLQSQPPRHSEAGAPPSSRKRGDKRSGNARPKSRPLPAQIFIHFKTLAMACANFTITMPIGLTGAFRPVPGQKTNSPPNLFWFSGFSLTCHCHGYAFPCKCWLNFFIWWIDQWQVFGWYWSNFEHCSLQPKFKPFWPPSQRGRWATHHLLGFYFKKLCNLKANFLHLTFCKHLWLVPSWALTF